MGTLPLELEAPWVAHGAAGAVSALPAATNKEPVWVEVETREPERAGCRCGRGLSPLGCQVVADRVEMGCRADRPFVHTEPSPARPGDKAELGHTEER
jgi:hypothetical protein